MVTGLLVENHGSPSMTGFHNRSRPVFERYGKPHVMCRYEGKSIRSHRLEDDAICACCGRMATNAHHNPPVGLGTIEVGGKLLRPSLIAVCGSGTTGCHDGFHGGARFRADWSWDSPEYGDAWISGKLLEEYEPHDPRLYLFGCWEFEDRRTGRKWTYRMEM